MGAFDSIKRIFGFEADYNDPEIQDDDMTAKPANAAVRQRAEGQGANAAPPAASGNNGPRPEDIFAHVVEVFNQTLPDFLKNSVDPERQRKILYDGLTADLKAYVEASRVAAEAQCRRNFEQQKTQLQANLREMEARYSQYNSMRDDMQQKLLNSERQRRAVMERNKDLEDRVASLEAELEQFQLENKSLINKLKVADVRSGMQSGEGGGAEAVDTLIAAAVKTANEETEKKVRAEMENKMRVALEKARAEAAASANDSGDADSRLSQLRQTKDSEIEVLRKRLDEVMQKADGLEKTLAMNTDMQARQERRHNQEKEELQKQVDQMKARLSAKEAAEKTEASKPAADKSGADKPATDNSAEAAASAERRAPRRASGSRNLKAPSLAVNPSTPDDILSDTDWLVTPRATGENRNEGRRKSKTPPNDDQQLSLF